MVRAVVSRSPHREVGIVNAAWLLEHPVDHESHLEKGFIMIALACPVVIDIKHQPLEVWLDDAHTEKYTPDFEVTYSDGHSVIVEVKPEKFLAEAAARLSQARERLAAEGWRFMVVTDQQIQRNGLAARALLLMRYARLDLDPQSALDCKRLLEAQFQGSAKVADLVNAGVPEDLIWSMVARHQLQIPRGLNINLHESVTTSTDTGDCHDFFCQWLGIEAR